MWPEALRSDYVLPDLPRSHSRHALLWTSFQLRYSIFPGDDLTNTTRASHQHLPFLSRKIPCCASAGAGGLDMQGVGVEHAAGSSCWGGVSSPRAMGGCVAVGFQSPTHEEEEAAMRRTVIIFKKTLILNKTSLPRRAFRRARAQKQKTRLLETYCACGDKVRRCRYRTQDSNFFIFK